VAAVNVSGVFRNLQIDTDSQLLAEAKRKNFDITPTTGEELEALAKQVISQSPEVVERVKILISQ
jgi:hypothetical protein